MKTWFSPDGFIGDDPASKRNARWLFTILLLLILLILAACSSHTPWTPPPLPQAPPGWSPITGQGTQPCNDFDFPTNNLVGYCYNGSIKPRLGQYIHMTFTITGDASQLVPDGDALPPTMSLFLWRDGDNMTCLGSMQQYRWWTAKTTLTAGTHTVTARLTPENWTDCYGGNGAANPSLFEAALNDLRGVGYTFGGRDFAGHGIRASGPVHFTLNSFTVDSISKRRKHRWK